MLIKALGFHTITLFFSASHDFCLHHHDIMTQPLFFNEQAEMDHFTHLGDRAFLGMKAKSSKGKNSLGPMIPNPFVRLVCSLGEKQYDFD